MLDADIRQRYSHYVFDNRAVLTLVAAQQYRMDVGSNFQIAVRVKHNTHP
jgi:hypothetical protein